MTSDQDPHHQHHLNAVAHFAGRVQGWFPNAEPVNPRAEAKVEELRVTVPAATRSRVLRINHDTLTADGVAHKLGITAQTARSWMQEGRLPGRKVGSRWQVKEAELDDWIAEGKHDALPNGDAADRVKRDVMMTRSFTDGYGAAF